jgi:hypothetical protein
MVLGVLLALATAVTAQAACAPKVSGTFTYELSSGTRTLTLDAVASSPARGTFSYAGVGGLLWSGDVKCVLVDGPDAIIVGDITSTPDVDYLIERVHDGGLPGGAGDRAITFAGPGTVPYGCKFPTQWNLTGKLMVPITSGNIVVH